MSSSSVSESARKGRVVVIMGPPNAGKDTQAHKLSKRIGGVYMGSGEIFRAAADPRIMAIMASGDLIPPEDFIQMMGEAIRKVPVDKPVVMAGITKRPEEAEWLVEFLPSIGRWLDRVIYLRISQDLSIARSGERRKGRDDDHPGVQEFRWHKFFSETARSLEFFRGLGLLVEVDGGESEDEVAVEVDRLLQV